MYFFFNITNQSFFLLVWHYSKEKRPNLQQSQKVTKIQTFSKLFFHFIFILLFFFLLFYFLFFFSFPLLLFRSFLVYFFFFFFYWQFFFLFPFFFTFRIFLLSFFDYPKSTIAFRCICPLVVGDCTYVEYQIQSGTTGQGCLVWCSMTQYLLCNTLLLMNVTSLFDLIPLPPFNAIPPSLAYKKSQSLFHFLNFFLILYIQVSVFLFFLFNNLLSKFISLSTLFQLNLVIY